jgi:hypothetical protein
MNAQFDANCSDELEPLQRLFLGTFAKIGSVQRTGRTILKDKPAPADPKPWHASPDTPQGITLLHYQWLETSPAYNKAFLLAKAMFGEVLHEIAIERAVAGEEEQVIARGKLVTDEEGKPVTRRRYDRALLKMLIQWSTRPWTDLMGTFQAAATKCDTPYPMKCNSEPAPKAPTATGGPGQKVRVNGRIGYAID